MSSTRHTGTRAVFMCCCGYCQRYMDYRSQQERMKNIHIITGALLCVLSPAPSCTFPFWRSRLEPIPEASADNVECFLDYMELWVPRRQMDGLLLWLSRVMRFPVNLSSIDRSNRLISRCRYALDMDSNGNIIFRVHYSACNVQTQNGFHVLEIHMVRKSSKGNGQSDRYRMRCPAVTAAMGREKVRCDPNYIQVSRPMPLENAADQDWFLLFRGEIEVSVGDASLIGVEIEMNKSYVTFLDRQAEVLPLWIGHGVYVYSLEASCPLVTRGPGAEVTFHIPKQRMGLVKRGSYSTETVTLKNIVVLPPINVTVTENKHFVMVNAQAADLLRSQDCITRDNRQGIQDFYSLDLVLEFAEIAHPMNWTLENYYECTGPTSDAVQQETGSKNNEKVETSANNTVTGTLTEENNAIQSNAEYPLSSGADPSRSDNITSALNKATEDDFKEGSVEDLDISGSGDDKDKSSEQISATEMTELGNLTLNITNGSWTLVTKQPGPPERLQDKHGEISNVPLSNSTVTEESKKLRSTNVTSTLATTTCSLEIGGKHKTSNMESSEEARRTVVHSVVIGDGGSEASSAVVKQKDTINPRNSQQVSSKQSPSEKRAKDDADLWEVLIGDTLMELLDETTRDGFLSPMYRHRASSRRDTGSLEKAKTEKVPEKNTDETSGSSVTHQRRSARDLQHMSEDGVLSSSHIDWRIYGSPHEDLLYNTRSDDIETIRSAEQLIVEE